MSTLFFTSKQRYDAWNDLVALTLLYGSWHVFHMSLEHFEPQRHLMENKRAVTVRQVAVERGNWGESRPHIHPTRADQGTDAQSLPSKLDRSQGSDFDADRSGFVMLKAETSRAGVFAVGIAKRMRAGPEAAVLIMNRPNPLSRQPEVPAGINDCFGGERHSCRATLPTGKRVETRRLCQKR
ncbi:uncharacterized protein BCR38DRAFT_132719 [Pseudomassariella vexata]|uniref:Uncharacterized protein n=1 Tax=Pseudomassariella vexata TaxID=1141098 RepID=A0A1Y2EA63_9PEZI|nr:uncharacterized protein BCR38DRAFT_132719 [Pseudomassariella vexata]ORY68461.1 hypothetical protein BCR38DRAFT_132719 [Pseudomassariella vexata]